MYHSITIGEKNTWDDWHIVPLSRPVVNPPGIKTEYVDIPGANGSFDYSEILTGSPVYKDRTGSWKFAVMNDYQEWHYLYSILLSYLHGRYFDSIILEDEPNYKYKGRLTLNEWESSKDRSTITIGYVLSPYKQSVSGATDDWKWDDLAFGTSTDNYIIYYGNFDVNKTIYRNLYNPKKENIEQVDLILTSAMRIFYFWEEGKLKNRWREFSAGQHENCGIVLIPGENEVRFEGTGRVTVSYDKGNKGLTI